MERHNDKIEDFLNKKNYDIRKKHNARWIDQKCAIDVVSFLAECILEFDQEKNKLFTRTDIWHSQYAIDCVKFDFKKPDADIMGENEYDKLFGNSIAMFHYAGILKGRRSPTRKGKPYVYRVNDYEMLKYISRSPQSALTFLSIYIEKVLTDSGIISVFDAFFEEQTNSALQKCRKEFGRFLNKYTAIKKQTEPNKIFIKVINPLAFMRNKCGYVGGTISKGPITLSDIGYLRPNWYDEFLGKPKNITRSEHKDNLPDEGLSRELEHRSNRAKNKVRNYNRDYNNSHSELHDEYYTEGSVEIHHIFPKHDYDLLVDRYENLIALTIEQHRDHAHPHANMKEIVRSYQLKCILQKIDTIVTDELEHGGSFYDIEEIKRVLAVGFSDEGFLLASGPEDLRAMVKKKYEE